MSGILVDDITPFARSTMTLAVWWYDSPAGEYTRVSRPISLRL